MPPARFDNEVAVAIAGRTGEGGANACLFPRSDEAGWITGQIPAVDGGQIMRA